jgi:hypothetical protein
MPRIHSPRLVLAAGLALLAACSDDSPSFTGTEPPDLTATGGPPSSIATRPRFQLELQAAGSLRPGQPVQLTLTATGVANTPDAEIELILPEVASARESGWENYQPLRGRRIPAAASHRGALSTGARTVIQEQVTFPEPGYYSVWASARVRDADSIPDVENGELLLDQAHTVLYLLIDEQGGGRVTTELDQRALPPTALGSLGPRRDRPDVVAPPAGLARPPRPQDGGSASFSVAPGPRTQTTGSTLRLLVDYYDASASRFTPVEGAEYYLNLYNSSFAYVGGRSGFLPADGVVTVGCSEAYYAELVVYAYNDRVSVGGATNFRAGQQIDSQGVYPASDCSRGTVFTNSDPVPSHVFVSLNRTALGAQRHFGRSRPRMPAVLTSNTTIPYSTYCPNGNFSGCSFGGEDYLRIQTDSTTSYGQQIWGQSGVFITSHEYGHAYHEKALNGFIRYYSGCGTHSLTTLTAMRCALPEGFANYLAVAARPDETGYDHSWEINYYYTNWLAGQDGSRSEAAIAAFFYDLTDNNRWGPEAHDVVQYSGTVLGDVISGCQVYQGGAWIYNNGIDHLVYCFERRVDPAVTGSSTYFPTRSPDPTSYAVSSYTTDPVEVRRLWRRNLYNQ